MSKLREFRRMIPEQFEKIANGEYDDFEILVQIIDGDETRVTPLRMINFDEDLKTAWFAGNVSRSDKGYFEELHKMHQELKQK